MEQVNEYGSHFWRVKEERPFFSRTAQAKEIYQWSRDEQIPYEGPYAGELTRKTKATLFEIGRALSATKSLKTSIAGQKLMKMSQETPDGQKLFDHYLLILRSGQYEPGKFQTVDQWVLNYLSQFAKHLY